MSLPVQTQHKVRAWDKQLVPYHYQYHIWIWLVIWSVLVLVYENASAKQQLLGIGYYSICNTRHIFPNFSYMWFVFGIAPTNMHFTWYFTYLRKTFTYILQRNYCYYKATAVMDSEVHIAMQQDFYIKHIQCVIRCVIRSGSWTGRFTGGSPSTSSSVGMKVVTSAE